MIELKEEGRIGVKKGMIREKKEIETNDNPVNRETMEMIGEEKDRIYD